MDGCVGGLWDLSIVISWAAATSQLSAYTDVKCMLIDVWQWLCMNTCVSVSVKNLGFLMGVWFSGTTRSPLSIPKLSFNTFLTAVLSLGLDMSLLSCCSVLIRLSHVPTDHLYPSPPEKLSTTLLRYSLSSQPCWPLGQPQPNTNQVGGWIWRRLGGGSSPDFRGKIVWLTVSCCWWTGALPGYESGWPQRRSWHFCVRAAVWFGQEGLFQSPASPLNYAVCDSEWRRLRVCIHMCTHV